MNKENLSNEDETPLIKGVVIGRCISCINWSRYTISDLYVKDVDSNLGSCSILHNDVDYWDGIEVAQEKVKEGCIGCDNLYTHENFGCIHYDGL